MNVAWDYTKLAAGYVKRPEYAKEAIIKMLELIGNPQKICDIGAGDGHLTIELANLNKQVIAVEPNDAMRAHGIAKTKQYSSVSWAKGTGENTGQADACFDAVTFGSSFNVCDQIKALAESKRICKPGAGFACLWNHRDLENPIQEHIENIIKGFIQDYDYGNRRQDQTQFLTSSGYLQDIHAINGKVTHKQSIAECVEAWRSHGTLHRQCKDDIMFNNIISEIERYLISLNTENIDIPYNTKIWTGVFI